MFSGFDLQLKDKSLKYNVYFNDVFDNLNYEDSDYIVVLEGCILNKSKLLQTFQTDAFTEIIIQLYHKKRELFPNELSGEFRGFIFDKKKNKLLIYNNHTGTQRVFYHQTAQHNFYVDTNLLRLTKTVKDSEILDLKPNSDAFYHLVTIGYILGHISPLKNFFRLLEGSIILMDNISGYYEIKHYFDLYDIEIFKGSKKEALLEADHLFNEAVIEEYEKDLEMGKEHFTTISGGLDSRLVLFYALKNNFRKGQRLFCFSQKNYTDEIVAKEIAESEKLKLDFVSLEKFEFISNIDKLTKISEGFNLYFGSIHVDFAMSKLKVEEKKKIGLIHTGQIGGGVLGSYLKSKNPRPIDVSTLVYNKEFLEEFKEYITPYLSEKYREDIFLTKTSGFNATILGSLVFNQYSYQSSPFMNKDFLRFILSIPYEWRFRSNFYVEWIKSYCKPATQFVWERTHMKPNAKWKTFLGDYVMRRVFNYYQKFRNKSENVSMFPYQYYFDRNEKLRKIYDDYFLENIKLIEYDYKLTEAVKTLYSKDDFHKKVFAIHILSVHKLYFS